MSKYTPEQRKKIRSHPIYIKYSGAVPDDLRHLVYPDEAKPEPKPEPPAQSEESAVSETLREQLKASVALIEKEAKKSRKKAAEAEDVSPEPTDDVDSN